MNPFWKRFFKPSIIVFADFIDPFSYIGFENLRKAAGPCGVSLDWRGFEYEPDTPDEGYALETAANSDLRAGMWASVQQWGQKSGIALPAPDRVPKTRTAHLLVQRISDSPQKYLLISHLYQAYFERRLDLARQEVLRDIVSDLQLSPALVDRAAADKADRLEANREEAKAYAFPGLPGFVYRGKTYFGALSTSQWETIFKTS